MVPFGIPVFPDIHVPDDDDDGVPDDLPVLPDDVLLIIVKMYRSATVEDRDANGWWQVRQEMRYLPRCPKRKRIIYLKGFYVPRHGNLLQPVTGYFYRRLIRTMFATKERDPRLYQWFRQTFGEDDYLRSNQAAELPFIHCRYCGEATSVETRKPKKKGSTSVNSGPFEKRCVAWTTCGLNATG